MSPRSPCRIRRKMHPARVRRFFRPAAFRSGNIHRPSMAKSKLPRCGGHLALHDIGGLCRTFPCPIDSEGPSSTALNVFGENDSPSWRKPVVAAFAMLFAIDLHFPHQARLPCDGGVPRYCPRLTSYNQRNNAILEEGRPVSAVMNPIDIQNTTTMADKLGHKRQGHFLNGGSMPVPNRSMTPATNRATVRIGIDTKTAIQRPDAHCIKER